MHLYLGRCKNDLGLQKGQSTLDSYTNPGAFVGREFALDRIGCLEAWYRSSAELITSSHVGDEIPPIKPLLDQKVGCLFLPNKQVYDSCRG